MSHLDEDVLLRAKKHQHQYLIIVAMTKQMKNVTFLFLIAYLQQHMIVCLLLNRNDILICFQRQLVFNYVSDEIDIVGFPFN